MKSGTRYAMRAPQAAGYVVTIAVVALAELPLDWLVLVAMLCGGITMFAVETVLRRRR